MTDQISLTDNAKLIRKALKESFPCTRFIVRCHPEHPTIDVNWTDGPNETLVDCVVYTFQSAYFDGLDANRRQRRHLMNGRRVQFAAQMIFTDREYSDTAIQCAINAVYSRNATAYQLAGIQKPTVEGFRRGAYRSMQIRALHFNAGQSVQHDILETLRKRSAVLHPKESPTVKAVYFINENGALYDWHGNRQLKLIQAKAK